MDGDDELMIAICAIVTWIICELEGNGQKRKRKMWMRPWLKERDDIHECNTIVKLYKQFLAVCTWFEVKVCLEGNI